MEMVNGYVFLDLTKSNVYSKALKVLGTDKPVVIKEGSGAPYFVDSMALSGTSVVITKGGKTITIANDNTITNVGDIQNHLYEHNIAYSQKDENNNFVGTIFIKLKLSHNQQLTKIQLEEMISNNPRILDNSVYSIENSSTSIVPPNAQISIDTTDLTIPVLDIGTSQDTTDIESKLANNSIWNYSIIQLF